MRDSIFQDLLPLICSRLVATVSMSYLTQQKPLQRRDVLPFLSVQVGGSNKWQVIGKLLREVRDLARNDAILLFLKYTNKILLNQGAD